MDLIQNYMSMGGFISALLLGVIANVLVRRMK